MDNCQWIISDKQIVNGIDGIDIVLSMSLINYHLKNIVNG